MSKKIIAVVGGTGLQGSGVVDELLARGQFDVRVITRNANSEKANALQARGCEVVEANLAQPNTLPPAFRGAHGAFIVTNFWEPVEGWSEFDQGKAAVHAARGVGVQHYIWSTLPNCKAISNGKFQVHHFTGKARVDAEVAKADFAHFTFVEPPMYFQNFLSIMAPQLQEDGSKAWFMPMSATKQCMHAGDISEFGRLAARAFEQPHKYGAGQYLAQSAGLLSWQNVIDALNAQGHSIKYNQVSNETFDALPFPGAAELREMMNYFEEYTYFGPDAEAHISLANELCPEGFTSFADWARTNMQP